MRFNFFKIFFVFVLIAFVSGCSNRWFGEKPADPPELKVNYSENDKITKKCFGTIESAYDGFIEGSLQEEDFRKAMMCTDQLLALGESKVVGKDTTSYTSQEIDLIFSAGLLKEKKPVEDWMKRIYGIVNMLRGTEQDQLSKETLTQLFQKLANNASLFVKLSKNVGRLKEFSLQSYDTQERLEYWITRKRIFSQLIDIARKLWEDSKAPLVKSVILKQYTYLQPSFDYAQWEKWMDAVFLMNEIIFARTPDVIHSDNIQGMLKHMQSTFETIYDAYAYNEYRSWKAIHVVGVVHLYEKLFYGFLDEFYKSNGKVIRTESLSQLLKKLHIASESDADVFVSGIVDLKAQIFQSTSKDFTREDVGKLREILKNALDAYENVESQMKALTSEDLKQKEKLWGSPFKEEENSIHAERLGQVFLSYIDAFMKIYDEDKDQKLSLYVGGARERILANELVALLKTARKLKVGFQSLMGKDHVIHEIEDSTLETMGKAIFAIGDQIFPNSNQDGKLDHKEILAMIHFIVETSRMKSEAEQYLYGQEVTVLWNKNFFIKEFPQLVESFSGKDPGLFEYMDRIFKIAKFKDASGSDDVYLQAVYAYVRLIEHIFLKYDTNNQDQILNQGELEKFLIDFKSYFGEVFEYFQQENWKKTNKGKQTWGEWWAESWMGSEEFQKRALFYLITTGKIPTSWPEPISKLSKKHATREDFVTLIENMLKDAEN